MKTFLDEKPDAALDVDRAVLQVLQGVIRSEALTRDQIAHRAGLLVDGLEDISDRQVQKSIERLRQTPEGCEIMSSSGWAGYWMLGGLSEWEAHYREERSRSMKHMQRLRRQSLLIQNQRSNEQMGLFND